MKNKKILSVGIFVVLIAVLAVISFVFREKPVEGSKAITIEVINSAGTSTVYALKTDALYLKDAMDEAQEKGLTYTGEEDQYGYVVSSVNGEEADFTKDSAYWSFYVNDEYCNYGISSQPVEDGDNFLIKYEVYAAQ